MSNGWRRAWRVILVSLACVLLTGALGGLVIYADRSLDGLLDRHLEPGLALLIALLIGFLVGVMIENSKILFPVIALMCVGAACIYVAIILAPTWEGSVIRTTGLENFAQTRAILYFGLSFPPTAGGALLGRLFGELLPGGEFLADPSDAVEQEYWLDRRRRSTSGSNDEANLTPDSTRREL